MPENDRLVFNFGGDTSELEKKLRDLGNKLDNLERKSSSVLSGMGKNGKEDIARTNEFIEKMNNGMTRTVKLFEEWNNDSKNWEITKQLETTTQKLTAQEAELNKVITKYKNLTAEQRNSKAALDQYITGLKKVASMEGYNNSATTAKANNLAESALNQAANNAQKEITALLKEKLALEHKINEAHGHEKGLLTQQKTLLDRQIAAKKELLEYAGEERVAEDNIYKKKMAKKQLDNAERMARLRNNKERLNEINLLKTKYGYVAEILNIEKKTLGVIEGNYNARMKETIAAQKLAKELNVEQSKHINNGTAMGKFMNSAIYSMSGMAQFAVYSKITEGFQAIKDYENGIVDLRRTIQGVTETELKDFGVTAITYAKDFGIELKEVQDAMTELARAGVDDANTLKQMTEVVSIGLNTTEIETAADMTGYLVSTVKQLGMDMSDSMEIIDTWNYLADQYAVHTDDFALAIQRAGSASKNLGLDLYDVNAMVTILGEATQASGQNIGTALRSMEVRILRPDTIRTLESYGITVKKNEEEFLSFKEIMTNVNDVIKDMDENSIDLNNIMDALGGSWRKNWVTTLANDWERFDELVAEQHNNIGYSVAENEKAMDTLEKKITQMNQAWLEFVINSANESGLTETLKSMADAGTTLFEMLDDSNAGVLITGLAKVAAGILAAKGAATALNKVLGTNLPNSVADLAEIMSRRFGGENGIFGKIFSSTDRQSVGMDLFKKLTGESSSVTQNLREQLEIARQIDKQFNTNTESLAQQRIEVQNLERDLATVREARASEGNDGATPAGQERVLELVREEVQLENQLRRAREEQTEMESVLNTSDEEAANIRRELARRNFRLVASQLALNAAFTAATAVISWALAKAYDAIINRQENLIEAGNEANDAFTAMTEKYQNYITTLSDLQGRYDELSIGVNDLGENVSLSSDEYEEYLNIVKQVRDITPELVDSYTTENNTIKHRNGLIEESIALLKDKERLDKISQLTESGEDRVKGAVAKENKLMRFGISESDAAAALREGFITKDEYDTFKKNKYRSSITGYDSDIDAIENKDYEAVEEKIRANIANIRDDVKAARQEAYQVLKDWASTIEGYEDMSVNQQAFVNAFAESIDVKDFEKNYDKYSEEIKRVTENLESSPTSKTLIDEIVNADKTEMKLDEYEEFVTSRIEQLYEDLDVDKDAMKLEPILDVDDDLENINLVREELRDMLNTTDEEFNTIISENSVDSLYDLYEVFDKLGKNSFIEEAADALSIFASNAENMSDIINMKTLNSLEELEDMIGSVRDESGKLNTSLLKTIKSLDSDVEIIAFDGIMDQLDELDFDKYSNEIYDMASDFVEALSFEDLDPSNMEGYLNSLNNSLGSFFDEQSNRIDSEIDRLYELGDAYNDWTEKSAKIENMNKASREYYDTMQDLAQTYPDLVVGVDNATGAYILHEDALNMVDEKMKQNIIDQQNFIQALINAGVAMAEWAENALLDIQNVLNGGRAASNGILEFAASALNGLAGAIEKSNIAIRFIFGNAAQWLNNAAESIRTLSFVDNKDKDGDGVGDVTGAIDIALSVVRAGKTKMQSYKPLADNYSVYKGGYPEIKSSSGKNKSSKNAKEEYKAEADQYHSYTQRLKDIQQLLEENEILEDLMTDSIEDQITLLSERNGLLEMESKATERLMNAKKKELNDAVWELNQLGYDVQWNRDANTLLINNYKKLESVSGDAAKAQEEMLKKVVSLNDEIRDYSTTIQENTAAIYKNNYAIQQQKWEEELERKKRMYEQQQETLENYQDSLETLIDLAVDMLKQQYEAERDEIEKVTDSYKEMIDAKKEALSDEANQEDYEIELAKKQKEVADLENKIKELTNDDSAEARAQRLTLEEELIAKQEELRIYQRDHNIELAQEALDKEYEDFENMQNDKLDAIDDYLDQEGTLREEAMEMIASQSSSFYNKLIEYNRMYGDGVDATVTEAWNYASEAIGEFGINSMNTLDILADIADEMERVQAAADALDDAKFVYNPEETYGTTDATNNAGAALSEKGKQQLNQQKYLHNLMVEAKEQNKTGLIAWIKQNRKEWGLDPDTGAIIEQFHTGGFVGNKPLLQSNEMFAKLLKGEFVITPQQMDDFIRKIMPNIAERVNGSGIVISNLINVEGNVDKSTIPALQNAGDNAIEQLNTYLSKNGFTRNAKKTVV